jgi:hypothetical protein
VSTASPDLTSFTTTVLTVRAAVDAAARRGDGSGMLGLRRRLDLLLTPSSDVAAGQDALLEIVHSAIVSGIRTHLRPKTARALAKELRGPRTADKFADTSWGAFDPESSEVRARRISTTLHAAQLQAIRACRHYERTRRTGYLRDAVKTLEAARREEAQINGSRLSLSTSDREFQDLGTALAGSMDPWASAFFAQALKEEVMIACREANLRLGEATLRRLDSLFIGVPWDMNPDGEPSNVGRHFTEPLQGMFEQILDDARRSRATEEAKRLEQQRRFEEWQATRNKERRRELPAEEPHDTMSSLVDAKPSDRPIGPPMELVQLPEGPKWLRPDEAAAVRATLAWQARHDESRMEQEEARKEHYALLGKRYEPRPRRV